MNRPILSAWPLVGLFLTWCIVLGAQQLVPSTYRAVGGGFWVVALPAMYALSLWYGYRSKERTSVLAQIIRLSIVALGAFGALLVNAGNPSGALFFAAAMVQVSLGVTMQRERSLYASLVISIIMLGFVASRPRSDTPLILTLLPFFICFVFTLVSNQFSQSTKNLPKGVFKGGITSRLGAGAGTIALITLVGLAILSVSSVNGKGPLDWKVDQDLIADLAGQGSSALAEQGLGGADSILGGGASSPGGIFGRSLQYELSRAETLGDVFSGIGRSLKRGGTAFLQSLAEALSSLLKNPPWWLWLFLLTPFLFYRARLRAHVVVDRLLVASTGFTGTNSQRLFKQSKAIDRLAELRGIPRESNQTWPKYASTTSFENPYAAEIVASWAKRRDRAFFSEAVHELDSAQFKADYRDVALCLHRHEAVKARHTTSRFSVLSAPQKETALIVASRLKLKLKSGLQSALNALAED